MKKLILGAAIAAAGAALAVESSNIVGYGHYTVPNGYSIWCPVFKNVTGANVDLNEITPCTPAGVQITGDNKILIFKLGTDGKYGTTYKWCPASCGGWSADDGATKISNGTVTFNGGEGFGMSNSLKTKDGTESTARTATASAATMLVSGEVDLVCKNAVPVGYSISGNATPNSIYLSQITPMTPAGVAITGNNKILVFKLGTDGKYGTTYKWCPASCGGWSADNGTTKIADDAVAFAPGEGFGLSNSLKTKDGEESTARTATASAALLSIPSPIE